MPIYPREVVTTTSEASVLLKFVESIHFSNDTGDVLVEKLRDDILIYIRTISGAEYSVSTKALRKAMPEFESNEQLAESIYDRWVWLHKD